MQSKTTYPAMDTIKKKRKVVRSKSSNDQLEIKLANSRGSKQAVFCWSGRQTGVTMRYFPLWASGVLHEIPISKCKRVGTKWIVQGKLKSALGVWTVEDQISVKGNTAVIDRRWHHEGARCFNVRLGMDLDVPFRSLDYWSMPSVSMNGNEGSETIPTGMERNGKPWSFREERMTAPGLMTLESGGLVAGSYTEAGRSDDMICASSVWPEKGAYRLRTFFPFREGPVTFLGAGYPGQSERQEQGLYVGSNGCSRGFVVEGRWQMRRKFYVVLDRTKDTRHGYVRVWESAWKNLKDEQAAPVPVKKIKKILWDSLEPFWFNKGKVKGYVTRIDRHGDILGGFSPTIACGWCGPIMMLTYLGIRKDLQRGKIDASARPIQAVNFFVEEAAQKNGVFLSHYNVKTMSWSQGDINAVQLGGASMWLLRAVALLEGKSLFTKKINLKKWKAFALNFCDLAVRTQQDDGAFGAYWNVKGECIGHERTMGIHAARAVLEAYGVTGDRSYLRSAELAASFYAENCVKKEAGYGDCTDILNSTTENDGAGVPDFYIDLYRVTGEKRYLDYAIRSAEYCLAYMYTYNVFFPTETECGIRKMRTRGFSSISPETGFICSWFVHQANAFLELWKETGEKRWKEYAVAVIRATFQMMAEPKDMFGLDPSLIGARAEVIPLTDTVKGVHIWKKGMTGYTWHQPVWWPAVFNLQNLAFVEDRFPEVKKEIMEG